MLAPGKILIDKAIRSTLSTLPDMLAKYAGEDCQIDLWTLDPAGRRRKAEAQLRKMGIRASIRSAYKPLVHAFREEISLGGISRIEVHYPIVSQAPENRFLLEAYPLDALVGGRKLEFAPLPLQGVLPFYQVHLIASESDTRIITVPAPNHAAHGHLDAPKLSPSGWLRVRRQSVMIHEGRLETDLEIAFREIISLLMTMDVPETDPCFERLVLRIDAPFEDEPLGIGHEAISLAEALHEDLYFSALEIFGKRRGLPPGDRRLMPGQIVPDIRRSAEPIRVRVETAPPQKVAMARPRRSLALETARSWLTPSAIAGHLRGLGGKIMSVSSQQGRRVEASFIGDHNPGLVISAGQHANETSGPVGALRAAQTLAKQGGLRIAVSPLENPDGYALFRDLAQRHPAHMHHAARYTASGADLEYMKPGFENDIRTIAKAKTGAWLHLSLHGYPAHEWTRPFTGYIPQGFESWTLPKGFFLILRHKPGARAEGEAILDAVLRDLQLYAPVVALNRAQLARQPIYGAPRDFDMRGDFPVFVREVADPLFPVTIITEAPDETIHGEDFVVAHTAHMRVVIAAANALKDIGALLRSDAMPANKSALV